MIVISMIPEAEISFPRLILVFTSLKDQISSLFGKAIAAFVVADRRICPRQGATHEDERAQLPERVFEAVDQIDHQQAQQKNRDQLKCLASQRWRRRMPTSWKYPR